MFFPFCNLIFRLEYCDRDRDYNIINLSIALVVYQSVTNSSGEGFGIKTDALFTISTTRDSRHWLTDKRALAILSTRMEG